MRRLPVAVPGLSRMLFSPSHTSQLEGNLVATDR